MFPPSSSGLVGTACNQHAASGHARHQGRRQPPVARKNCRSIVPAGQNAGTFNIRGRHGPGVPLAPLASAPLPFPQTAPLGQHPIGAASHGWRIRGSFLCPDVSMPDVSKSAVMSMCPFGAAGVGRSRQTSSCAVADSGLWRRGRRRSRRLSKVALASRRRNQDQLKGRRPRPLCWLPDGRGRHSVNSVRRSPAADRGTADGAFPALGARCHRLGCAGASRRGLAKARPKWQTQPRNLVIGWMSV